MDSTYREEPPRAKIFRFEPPPGLAASLQNFRKKFFFKNFKNMVCGVFEVADHEHDKCFSKILKHRSQKLSKIKILPLWQKLGSVAGRVSRSSYMPNRTAERFGLFLALRRRCNAKDKTKRNVTEQPPALT